MHVVPGELVPGCCCHRVNDSTCESRTCLGYCHVLLACVLTAVTGAFGPKILVRGLLLIFALPLLRRGVVYSAAVGEGTFVRALSGAGDDTRRVMVSSAKKPCDTRVLESVESGHTSHGVAAKVCSDLGIELAPIRIDSQCKYGMLSEGQVSPAVRAVVFADNDTLVLPLYGPFQLGPWPFF